MKIPKKIQIAGREIQIIYDAKRSSQEGYNGACYYDHSEIILNKNLDKEKESVVLIHEVLHFINAILLKDGAAEDKDNYVRPLSEFLYQVFKQLENKWDNRLY